MLIWYLRSWYFTSQFVCSSVKLLNIDEVHCVFLAQQKALREEKNMVFWELYYALEQIDLFCYISAIYSTTFVSHFISNTFIDLFVFKHYDVKFYSNQSIDTKYSPSLVDSILNLKFITEHFINCCNSISVTVTVT